MTFTPWTVSFWRSSFFGFCVRRQKNRPQNLVWLGIFQSCRVKDLRKKNKCFGTNKSEVSCSSLRVLMDSCFILCRMAVVCFWISVLLLRIGQMKNVMLLHWSTWDWNSALSNTWIGGWTSLQIFQSGGLLLIVPRRMEVSTTMEYFVLRNGHIFGSFSGQKGARFRLSVWLHRISGSFLSPNWQKNKIRLRVSVSKQAHTLVFVHLLAPKNDAANWSTSIYAELTCYFEKKE